MAMSQDAGGDGCWAVADDALWASLTIVFNNLTWTGDVWSWSCAGDRERPLFEASASQWKLEWGHMCEVMTTAWGWSLSTEVLRHYRPGCAPAEAKRPFAHSMNARGFSDFKIQLPIGAPSWNNRIKLVWHWSEAADSPAAQHQFLWGAVTSAVSSAVSHTSHS